ncbi:MAG TPA: FAD-dependent oxidoreductase [Stellaceae bacterium]|nr:FAD-dependent oxidoreductase [Stellaceae bacterium]
MAEGTGLQVVVIGAGVVGMAAASFLQRDGHRVTVIDPGGPGEGASFGNAGCLNGSSVVPMSMPGMLSSVPRWLLDPEGPLVIRWRYLPVIAPWLWRFIRAGEPAKVEAQARALRSLLAPSVDAYLSLARDAGAADLIHRAGHLWVYQSEASFAKDTAAMELRRRNGVTVDDLGEDELRQMEPSLSRAYRRGRFVAENGHVGNPHRLVKSLAEALVRNGGRVLRERAFGFEFAGGKVSAVRSEGGIHKADRVVVAAGAWSKPFAAALGDKVPLDTERGYHIVLRDPEVVPRMPVSSAEGKFVATPMETGLRMAGTVEFAGLEAPPDWRRARMLLKQARAMFPGLPPEVPEERLSLWMGFRPSLPDSLPVIGPATRHPNAIYAFGHGHVGLACGAMTGRLVADLVAGRPPSVDIAPFRVGRFA